MCAVCGGDRLEPHHRVAGRAGPDGLIPTTDRYGTALADIVRCAECGHMQLWPLPASDDLRESYAGAASGDYVEEEAGQRRTARTVLEAIEAHVPPGRLLDLGCWVGFLLAEAEGRGWTGVGVEPSDYASRYAREQLGLDVRTAELLDADLGEQPFDAVMMGDVIEHLPDPGAALDQIASALRPGGVLALALPDAGSRLARAMGRRWWSVIPTHVHYFTRSSISRLLSGQGFRVLEITTSPKSFTVRYYLGRLTGYSPRVAGLAVGLAERAAIADRQWAPDFRDRMLVLATRSG